MSNEHECDGIRAVQPVSWTEETPPRAVTWQLYGHAITGVRWFDSASRYGSPPGWYAHNDEYATRIRYCPFCGVKLGLKEGDGE